MSINSRIIEVINFAAEAHKNQRRKNATKDPYINHPIRVAKFIQEIGGIGNYEVLASAYLHDVVEDTNITLDDIENIFGEEIRNIVDEVSNNTSLSSLEQKQAQVETASHKSYEAKLVKLGDLYDNLSSLINDIPPSWSVLKTRGYFVWKYFVLKGYVGTNENLENAIKELFFSQFEKDGEKYYTLPSKDENILEGYLQAYYDSLVE